jgi:hypothetical protein
VSKERARRRAQREAAAVLLAARQGRRARWRALVGIDRLRRLRRRSAARPARARTTTSTALGRRRARENGLLLAVLVPLNAVYWLLEPSWVWRLGALVATAIVWPLLVVVVFDRRSSH